MKTETSIVYERIQAGHYEIFPTRSGGRGEEPCRILRSCRYSVLFPVSCPSSRPTERSARCLSTPLLSHLALAPLPPSEGGSGGRKLVLPLGAAGCASPPMRIYPAVGRRGLHKADACPGLELSGGGLALCPPNPEARGGKEDPRAQQPGQVRPLRPVSRNVALLLPGVRSIPGPAPRPPLCAEPRPPAAGPAPRRPALAGAPPRGPHGAGRTNMLARLSEAAPTAGQWRGRRGAGARRALAAGGRRGASLGPRAGSAAPRGQVRRGRGMEPERPQQAPSAAIREGWFRETCSLWPGQAMSLQVDELLYAKRSRFQEILVFRRCRAPGAGPGRGDGAGAGDRAGAALTPCLGPAARRTATCWCWTA